MITMPGEANECQFRQPPIDQVSYNKRRERRGIEIEIDYLQRAGIQFFKKSLKTRPSNPGKLFYLCQGFTLRSLTGTIP
jgi:hypothetical protein